MFVAARRPAAAVLAALAIAAAPAALPDLADGGPRSVDHASTPGANGSTRGGSLGAAGSLRRVSSVRPGRERDRDREHDGEQDRHDDGGGDRVGERD